MNVAYLFEREFELRYLKSRGTAFQEFFSDIMERAYPGDFQRVRPHGNTGDLKCDGYLTSERSVFQVYGPEEIRSLRRLLQKIQDDFTGALLHWTDRMDRWVFVHNCPTGLPAQAIQLLEDLRKQPNAPLIETWGFENLRQVLLKISQESLQTLFPVPPHHTFTPLAGRLPKPSTITSFWKPYWVWMVRTPQTHVSMPHLASLETLRLPIRLKSPEDTRKLRLAEDHAKIKSGVDTSAGILVHKAVSSEVKPNQLGTKLEYSLLKHPHLLIVGDSGSGKSTLLRRFARREAKYLNSNGIAKARRQTPVLVELWQFGPGRHLLGLILSSVKRSGLNVSQSDLLSAIEHGYVMLLLDGLDDVPQEYRRECLAQIVNLVEQYPHIQTVLTSRPFPAPPDRFHRLAIEPLTDEDIAAALGVRFRASFRKRFNCSPKEYVSSHLHPEVRELSRRPLILGLMLTLLESSEGLPETLYSTYDRFLSLLLDWEVRAGRLQSVITATTVLEETAHVLMSSEQVRILSADWLRTAGRAVSELNAAGITKGMSAEEIFQLLLSTGIIVDYGGAISFLHKSFLEFLAARCILQRSSPAHTDPVAFHAGVSRFLFSEINDVSSLLEEHFLRCEDVENLMPLLEIASKAGCIGGRFEALYRAIGSAQELAVNLSYSSAETTVEEEFTEEIEELVQTSLDFKPKALSVLKEAADGVVRADQWKRSRIWFEKILAGLEAYGWSGTALHRRFVKLDVFEKMDAFSDDGSDVSDGEYVDELFSYLKAMHEDDFVCAIQHLNKLEELLRGVLEPDGLSHPSLDTRTLKLPFPNGETG